MIYLEAGHGLNDPGACANGLRESDLTKDLRDIIAYKLKSKGYQYKIDDDMTAFPQSIFNLFRNSTDKDIILAIHFNSAAANVSGVESWVGVYASPMNILFADKISKSVSIITGSEVRATREETNSRFKSLYPFRYKGIKVLLEVEFISNLDAIKKYMSKKWLVAESISNILIEHEDMYK